MMAPCLVKVFTIAITRASSFSSFSSTTTPSSGCCCMLGLGGGGRLSSNCTPGWLEESPGREASPPPPSSSIICFEGLASTHLTAAGIGGCPREGDHSEVLGDVGGGHRAHSDLNKRPGEGRRRIVSCVGPAGIMIECLFMPNDDLWPCKRSSCAPFANEAGPSWLPMASPPTATATQPAPATPEKEEEVPLVVVVRLPFPRPATKPRPWTSEEDGLLHRLNRDGTWATVDCESRLVLRKFIEDDASC